MVEAVQQHVKSVSFELRRELRDSDVTYLNAHGEILEPHTVQERVVGLHLMGPSAGEVIQGFALALRCGLIKQQLDTTVGLHPVCAQVLTKLTVTQRATDTMMVRGNC
ncbi:thioredoxin reductase 1, cytoplasmic-like [Salvelinus namaycush]|uniref:Thioredoxin reductase 1, cytoplasmic n=1 Tax=Salvelinus namaycush TaxID=8040 RepID=A0A8U0Q014_SALNM|nr:thioredoxin reductase 1, cytoplasmic-like [Salvelinus namaycush]